MAIATATLLAGAALAASAGAALKAGKAPKVGGSAVADTQAAARKAKRSRSALFETAGGVKGEEVLGGGVQSRSSTLLGN